MTKSRTPGRRVFALFIVAAATYLAAQSSLAEARKQGPNDAAVAKTVVDYLQDGHLGRQTVDDHVAQRTFWALVQGSRTTMGFDPAKLYFTQADIDELRQHETTLDDELAKGDLSLVYKLLDRYLTRMRERTSLVEEFVNAEHDMTVDEYISTDYENLEWARTPEETRERWRKRIKLDLLQQRLDKKPLSEAEQKEKVLKRYRNLLHRWEQTDSDELLEMYLNALTTSFDPHSNYMSPTTWEDFNISMRLHLDGIGAKLRSEDGYTIVAEVLPGGAADRDGRLQVEDKIVGVAADGENVVDVVDLKLTDVVKKIRGKRGTPVLLRVMPVGKSEIVEYKLTRDRIELKEQEAKGRILEHGEKSAGVPYRIGYISLPSFYLDIAAASSGQKDVKSCTQDVRKLLEQFQAAEGGIDGVILDLRSNGGGALSEAIGLTDLFIDQGPVVKVKNRADRVLPQEADNAGLAYSGPLVVLVNKLSASASEIFAGAIQDYGRGIVVGDSATHGKGTVQTVVDISGRQHGLLAGNDVAGRRGPQLGALKLTIQQFYRVNGESTQSRGVIADIVLPAKSDHIVTSEADLPQAIPFGQVRPSEHANLGMITPELKSKLQELSSKRVESSSDFRKVIEDIAKFEEIKKRKAIALNEERLREETKNDDADEDTLEDPNGEAKPKKKDAPLFESNFYNNEVLSIMEDYLKLGGHSRVAKKL